MMMFQNFIFNYFFPKDFIFYHSVIEFCQTAPVVNLHDK